MLWRPDAGHAQRFVACWHEPTAEASVPTAHSGEMQSGNGGKLLQDKNNENKCF